MKHGNKNWKEGNEVRRGQEAGTRTGTRRRQEMMTIAAETSNPFVQIGGCINSNQIQGLLTALKETTGKFFGYLPQGMVDTQFYSFVLTLCHERKLSKSNRRLVDCVIRSWCMGYGLGNPIVRWTTY